MDVNGRVFRLKRKYARYEVGATAKNVFGTWSKAEDEGSGTVTRYRRQMVVELLY